MIGAAADYTDGVWTTQHNDAAWEPQNRGIMRAVRRIAPTGGSLLPSYDVIARVHGGIFALTLGLAADSTNVWSMALPSRITSGPTGGWKIKPIKSTLGGGVDADMDELVVDIGTQTVSIGDDGISVAGINQDAQKPIFYKTGGTGGGGSLNDFGDGFDGNIDLTGGAAGYGYSNAPAGASPYLLEKNYTRSGITVYTLTRACVINALTIPANTVVFPNSRQMRVLTLLGAGAISTSPQIVQVQNPVSGGGTADGNQWYASGSGNLGGDGELGRCNMGASGHGAGFGVGYNTINNTGSRFYIPKYDGTTSAVNVAAFWGMGGAGGNGVANGGQRASPSMAAQSSSAGAFSAYPRNLDGYIGEFTPFSVQGGQSGAGGGGDNAAKAGGDGGDAGGYLSLRCKDISGFTGSLSSDGSPGLPGQAGGGATGGGGGGGGGPNALATLTPAGSIVCTRTASGGTGGAGASGGSAGANGTAGPIWTTSP